MKNANPPIRDIDIKKTWVLENTEQFTRFFFKLQYNRKFVIGDHHRAIWRALDRVISGECKRLMINMPPRYGKTETAVKAFIAYGLALNAASKFIHLSYADDLVRDNSKAINDLCSSPEYLQLFPDAKPLSSSSKKWYTNENGGLYAVASGGQVTGFGAGVVDDDKDNEEDEKNDLGEFMPAWDSDFAGAIVIDDPIKPDDARSDLIREKVNQKFETTIRSRTNSRNTPIVIIMQRLDENDLCGYLMGLEPEEWEVLSLPAIITDGDGNEKPLWKHKHTLEELYKLKDADEFVFETQYLQNPKPLVGLMYERFNTYDIIPKSARVSKKNYTDTADTGADYLCSMCYDELKDGRCYVTDILFTQKPMEFTEPTTAEMLTKNQTKTVRIESNNGGRGFSRAVEVQCREMNNFKTKFIPFTQTDNKQVRIYNHSNEVQNMIFFPSDWERRWPEFAKHIKRYKKDGGNKHDDAADVLTGIIENIGKYTDGSSWEGALG